MTLDLYLLTDEPDPRLARIVSQSDTGRLPLPVLTYGERLTVSIWLVKRDGTLHADSGSASLTAALLLGKRGASALVTSSALTAASSKWTGTLDLTTDALALSLNAVNGGAGLVLQFRTNTTAGSLPPNTWLSADVTMIGRVAA